MLKAARERWGTLSANQKIVVGMASALLALIVVWSSITVVTPPMALIAGADVPEGDRAAIQQKLTEKNQRFEVRNGEIWVPSGEKDRMVLELIGEGIFNDKAIYRFLEEPGLWETTADKKMKFRVAVQRKLERTIRAIRGVRNASILITPADPSERAFREGAKASASVQLELLPRHELTRDNVAAITGFVVGAVEGLGPDRVHIMDTQGRPYRIAPAESADGSPEGIRRLEERVAREVRAKLEEAFPSARIVVGVEADGTSRTRRATKHGRGVPREEREHVRRDKPAAGAASGGIKGQGTVDPESKEVSPGNVDDRKIETIYAPDQEQTTEETPAGAIKRITVGILLPVEEKDLERERAKEAQYRAIARAAAPQLEEGAVSVMFVPTVPPAPLPPPGALEEAHEWMFTAGGIALAIASLIVLYWIVRAVLARRVSVEPVKAVEEIALPPVAGAAPAETEVTRIRTGLRDMISRNPRGVAAIVKRRLLGK